MYGHCTCIRLLGTVCVCIGMGLVVQYVIMKLEDLWFEIVNQTQFGKKSPGLSPSLASMA